MILMRIEKKEWAHLRIRGTAGGDSVQHRRDSFKKLEDFYPTSPQGNFETTPQAVQPPKHTALSDAGSTQERGSPKKEGSRNVIRVSLVENLIPQSGHVGTGISRACRTVAGRN